MWLAWLGCLSDGRSAAMKGGRAAEEDSDES
jgi:hypothetical protein